jgi:hypothetical protein
VLRLEDVEVVSREAKHPPHPPTIERMADTPNPQIDLTGALTYEILRDIFHQATFIPHELDVAAISTGKGLFCFWDELHIRAWEEVLPLRIAIARVSRLWRAVALEFQFPVWFTNGPNRRAHMHISPPYTSCE